MFSSVRVKLLFFMTINIIIFGILLYGSNKFFAEKYYTERKKNLLIDNSNKIKEIIKDQNIVNGEYSEDVIYEINRLEKNIGAVIVIGNINGPLYYPNVMNPYKPFRPEIKNTPFFVINENSINTIEYANINHKRPKINVKFWEIYNKDSFFVKIEDPNIKIETLRFQTEINKELTLLIWVPMDQISESVSVSNTFTGIIALITIIISAIWALFISKNFTRPITKMNSVAQKMAKLDFSETIQIKGKDELGQLSRSINYLSQKLDSSITKLNLKNMKLEKAIDHERKLDKMRKEFVSSVSHDLKTPIFLIQGYAEGLKNNIAQNEEKRYFYCDVIMEETEKMNKLVMDLLDLSQMESGTFSINRVNFNISNLINDIIIKMNNITKSRDINIKTIIPSSIIVNADIVRIEQVLTNLINNAVNYVDENKIISITFKEYEENFRIIIYNSGQHIPDESLDKIWTSFYKVNKARTRKYDGSGLGLSIVKAIQDAHNNSFGVNNVDNGVEFWFDLDKGNINDF